MYISFNPGISFKQSGIQGAQKGAQEANAAAQGGVQGTNMSQKPAPKQPKKRSSLREDISKIAKFFTTLGEMTKASFKAAGYGALTVAASLAGFWAFGAVPKGFKKGNNVLDAFKHPIKNISKKGKFITALLGLGVASYHLIKGKLISNQRTANVDHQLKTGHRPA